MLLHYFSVYDTRAKAWDVPFLVPDTESIERAWQAHCNDPQTKMNKHPDDYCLYRLGSFDRKSGKIDVLSVPESIGLARAFIL